MIFDTHIHLTSLSKNLQEIKQYLDTAKNKSITKWMNVATSIDDYSEYLELKKHFSEDIIFSIGLSPEHSLKDTKPLISELEKQLNEKQASAIGEIGLDFYWDYGSEEVQKKLLLPQIEFAISYNLPIIIHCRKAYSEMYQILKSFINLPPIIMHCFSGDVKEAEFFLGLNAYISFAGNVTFPKAENLHNVCKIVPLEKLLIETDAPYLSPQEFRGKKNIPEYIFYTAKFVSQIKSISYDQLCNYTFNNACKIFGLKHP